MKPLILALSLAIALPAYAQKDIPSYGKIDKADLTMDSVDFDPGAEACVLIKTGDISFNLSGEATLITEYRYRIKVLKDKGVNSADIKIRYYSRNKLEDLTSLSGETYNLDASGNIVKTKLDHSNVYTKQVSKNWSEMVFTMPDVKKGSVFEYKYTKTSKAFWDIDNWEFQTNIPTRYCQLYMTIPQYFDFTYQVRRVLPLQTEHPQDGITVMTMKNIPGLKDEPYMASEGDYLQRAEFQLASIRVPGEMEHTYRTNWGKLNDELLDDDDFGIQLHKNIPHTDSLDAALNTIKDSTARMAAVFEYVRRHMDWNESEGFYSESIKSAWDKKVGSIADINLILVNLLRDAHLDAHPILVSTRENGHVNTLYPLLDQFNAVMAVVNIGEKTYILNAADKYTPYRLIPFDVQYSQGFVIDKDQPRWITLVDNKDAYKNMVILNGDIDASGIMTGTASIHNYDYSKNFRCKNLATGLDKYKDTYFNKDYTNLKIDSLSIEGQNNDSVPLTQTLQFTSKLNTSGQYLFITPNLFLGLESNPFVQDKRFSDVDFGYKQSYMIVGSISLPDGYSVESLPKNIRMIMQDTSIVMERLMQVDDGRLSYRISLDFLRPVYFTEEYPDFKEFYKKLYASLNEQIVLRKTNSANAPKKAAP